MKSILVSSAVVLLLGASHAFADDGLIYSSSETQGAAQDGATSIQQNDFTGGVSTSDAHDGGGGGMMIQMLMPNSSSSGTASTPGPFVARAAVSGGAH